MPELVEPCTRYQTSFLAAMAEFKAEGATQSMTADWIEQRAPGWDNSAVFAGFVDALRRQAVNDEPRPEGHVPSTTLWWVEEEQYLGRISIRPQLTGWWLRVGGHIGYDIRRSRRGEGHATAMLAAALPIAHRLGVDPALITCDADNVPSRKVIEANGGTLENELEGKLRFWVPTS